MIGLYLKIGNLLIPILSMHGIILHSCQDKTQPSNHHLDNIATSLT
ncbi:hypothetical protein AO364_1672 [Moraxella catarrhalis]|uniref:Uncharacterized protein n=1 Tax=Moraxella catarrhalis TaxID=480 RepID=A0AB36DQD2_MORCA|nr:hypothetical protein AO380_1711 [Moraxella catarrhalis]OAV24248.1 hypothetical protein AO369_1867 [Moraxella catarrhalis]OAV26784.1 hypothetical protein AO370_0617 [Moraxella catarrhalis]OAV29316.1 hypothetical protein AO367_2027 [Moraxella catarrhalis]OAV35507.1 hypothetical protein AO364_1672 [Moraxella catarrhalis]